jgi:hypothetical protein
LYGLETKAFQKVFGEEFTSVFGNEIQALLEQHIISGNKGTYIYSGTRTLKALFDYFAYARIFLGKKIIGELRKVYASKYDPDRDYGSREFLLKAFEDFEYAREYYQVGKKTLWL